MLAAESYKDAGLVTMSLCRLAAASEIRPACAALGNLDIRASWSLSLLSSTRKLRSAQQRYEGAVDMERIVINCALCGSLFLSGCYEGSTPDKETTASPSYRAQQTDADAQDTASNSESSAAGSEARAGSMGLVKIDGITLMHRPIGNKDRRHRQSLPQSLSSRERKTTMRMAD
jgi:hypothetical protein